MRTGTITWGSDQMTGVMAVRKLSDALASKLIEYTASTASNDGSFAILAPDANTENTYLYESKGTTLVDAQKTTVVAPISNVLSVIGNIAGDIATLRVNSALAQTDTGDQGTGNYADSVLYLFSRAGTSLFFLGRFYGMALYNTELSTNRVQSLEGYYKNKAKLVY
jgi:hypothetical protein